MGVERIGLLPKPRRRPLADRADILDEGDPVADVFVQSAHGSECTADVGDGFHIGSDQRHLDCCRRNADDSGLPEQDLVLVFGNRLGNVGLAVQVFQVGQFQRLHVPESAGQGIQPQGEFARLGAGPVGGSAIEVGTIAIALALSRAGKRGAHTGSNTAHVANIDPTEGVTMRLELAFKDIGRIGLSECPGR